MRKGAQALFLGVSTHGEKVIDFELVLVFKN